MAGQLPGRTGRGRATRRQGYAPMAEINVTPFVDVMLVLLVVFMITAPLLTAGVPVNLPQSDAKAINQESNTPIEITVDNTGQIYIGDAEVERQKLIPLLGAMTKGNPDRQIFIRGDQTINYGQIANILGAVSSAGFSKISLVTTPVEE